MNCNQSLPRFALATATQQATQDTTQKTTQRTTQEVREKTREKILRAIQEKPGITTTELAYEIGITPAAMQRRE